MVSTDDCSSSSESDCSSDEEIEENVKIAMESVKKSLTSNSQTESRTADFIQSTHQKIYDTFDSDDDSDDFHNENAKSSREKEIKFGKNLINSFVIDKCGAENSNDNQTEIFTIDLSGLEDSEPQTEEIKEDETAKEVETRKEKSGLGLSSSLDVEIEDTDIYLNVDLLANPKDKTSKDDKRQDRAQTQEIVEPEIMKKSVLTDDYENQTTIPTEKSKREKKRLRKIEKEKTKGSKWFDMPAPELTEDRKNDFLVYQMRKSLDPKRFYKTNDAVGIPKYYQFGTVVEHAADFYDSRLPKKERKPNMVEELLADAKFRQYNKRKFTEIQEARRLGSGPYNAMKKLKKKKAK